MSTYLSYRRRYSVPDKPEPRFQWRLRVHSLMMDDSDQTSSSPDRRVPRFDSSRDPSGAYGYDADARSKSSAEEPAESTDSSNTHRKRRERFTRTKSEGHLKLRVRFSKFSNTSYSFDDDDDDGDDEPRVFTDKEFRKCRSSQESGIGSFGEHQTDEDEDQPEKVHTHSTSQSEENSDVDDGFVRDETPGAETDDGAAAQSRSFTGNKEFENEEKDVSKGAIPKRCLYGRVSKSDFNNQSHDDGSECPLPVVAGSSVAIERQHEENIENNCDTHKTEKSLSLNEEEREKQVQSRSSMNDIPGHCEAVKVERKERERSEDCSTNQTGSGTAENNDNADDIESIIERIIAEEEAILAGKDNNSTKTISSDPRLNDKGILTKEKEDIELKDNDDDNETKDDNKGLSISRSTSQEKHRSSSLPSYKSDEDHSLSKTVVPFSTSCPSAQKGTPQKQEAKEEDDAEEDDGWAYLPVILLEDVFTLLSPKERHQASQVCRQWYDLFYSPRVWETFILLERTLTKKRFNLYKGYQRELCPGKTQLCFRRVGSFFKRIVVTPITDYFNLYEFLRILAAFLQYQEDHGLAAMPLLHTFDFTFACASRGDGQIIVHGTGGQILEMIKQLLIRISNLKHLKLNQLLVDEMDVPGLFDAMANCFGECLNSLEMLNVTKVPLGLTDLARFRNLVKLTVSPQHLNEVVLLLLAGLNLLQLHLLQDPYTCECEPVSYEAWKLVTEMAPWLRVYLEVSGNTRAHLLIQPRAPVYGVFLRTPYSLLTNDLVMSLVEYYSKTLRYFVQERLPRIHGPRGIDTRCDSSLLFLVKRCTALHTLVIRERISTSTLILLANEGKNLSTLLVRRHALIKRCDWPELGSWTKEFYSRLKHCSLDYDRCTDKMCTLLRRRWRPLTDKQFMRLKIVPRAEVY